MTEETKNPEDLLSEEDKQKLEATRQRDAAAMNAASQLNQRILLVLGGQVFNTEQLQCQLINLGEANARLEAESKERGERIAELEKELRACQRELRRATAHKKKPGK